MRNLLLALLVNISTVAIAQNIMVDTIYAGTAETGYTRYILQRNAATTTVLPTTRLADSTAVLRSWTASTYQTASGAFDGTWNSLTGKPTTTSFLLSSTNKNFVTDAQLTVIGNTTNTNSGNDAVNSLYSGLVSNATHTGDATGSTALTLATVNSNVGTFGSATQVPVFTVNGKGLVTGVTNTTITNISGNAATVTTNANLTGDVTSSGNATTVVKINGTTLSGLATGILKNTTTTGVPSIAVAGTDYQVPISAGDVITSGATSTIGALKVATGMVQANAITLAKMDATNATANKMLLSGASASPTWSTSTIPTSAGATANKAVVSDGTNYVLSTGTMFGTIATADIAATASATNTATLATPTADGMYRLTCYLKITVTGTSPVAGPVTITYTDADGSVAQSHVMLLQNTSGAVVTTTVNNSTTTGTVNGSMVMNAKSGTAITYAIAVSGTYAAGRYTCHFTLERLK
ncbi:MAG: hypothetical protein V4547_16860 [Bacteroidota bacterium]